MGFQLPTSTGEFTGFQGPINSITVGLGCPPSQDAIVANEGFFYFISGSPSLKTEFHPGGDWNPAFGGQPKISLDSTILQSCFVLLKLFFFLVVSLRGVYMPLMYLPIFYASKEPSHKESGMWESSFAFLF